MPLRSTDPWSLVAQDPVDRYLEDDARRVLPRLPVPLGVARLGVPDRGGVVPYDRRPLEGGPPASVDLADGDPGATAADVPGLDRRPGGDHPGGAGAGVEGEADRDDVRRAVGPQRGERGQVALDEEGEQAGAEVVQVDGHRGSVRTA